MTRPKPRITIVGLGLIGGSIGMALRQAEVASVVTGHDKEPGVSSQARKLGAVDRTDWNLVSACEEADLIILATPLGAIEPTLKAIGPYLQPDCVLVDTASLKEPVLAWAADILPAQVHFVGSNPIIGEPAGQQGGLEAARADLFRGGLFCLVPSPTAEPAAVKLVTDLVAILGAKPLFFDPAEHDGLLAAVDQLPTILALALLETAIYQPTWRELRRVAGALFEGGTHLASSDPAFYSDLCLSNRENVLRWIDTFSVALASVRHTLAEGQPGELAQRFEHSLEERGKWLQARAEGMWDEGQRPQMPERGIMLDTFLGTFWRRKPKQDR